VVLHSKRRKEIHDHENSWSRRDPNAGRVIAGVVDVREIESDNSILGIVWVKKMNI
jgi:hypothetical protein